MYYQLPTGKTIKISIDDFLSMTDEIEQMLVAQNVGDSVNTPFFDSVLKTSRTSKKEEEDDTIEDHMDFLPDSEEVDLSVQIDINEIPDEDTVEGF